MFYRPTIALTILALIMPVNAYALRLDRKSEIRDVEILRSYLFHAKSNVNQCQLNGGTQKNCYCQYKSEFNRLDRLYEEFSRKYPNYSPTEVFKYKIKNQPRFLSSQQYLKAIQFPYQCSLNLY